MSNCELCGKPASERHHLIFGRGMRPLADEDGLTMDLCDSCHKSIHSSVAAAKLSKIVGQLIWQKMALTEALECNGIEEAEEYTEERFRTRYGRTWV